MEKQMTVTKKLIEDIQKCVLSAEGFEINDPRVLFVDATPRPLTVKEQIQRLLRVELSAQAHAQGFETFEESEDFEVDDGFDVDEPTTKYTLLQEEEFGKPQKFSGGPGLEISSDEKEKVEEKDAKAKPGGKEGPGGAKRGRAGQKAGAAVELDVDHLAEPE